jgi:L-alanine-DL-glutamate epimerase-like enolase superfamily enzyme
VKIAIVESIQLRIPLAGEGRLEIGSWGGKGLPTVDSLIVKVVTDTGVVGWGETFGFAGIPAAKAAIDSILAPARWWVATQYCWRS